MILHTPHLTIAQDQDFFGQRFDAASNPVGDQFRIDADTSMLEHTIVSLPDGGFVVSWVSEGGANPGIYSKRFDEVESTIDPNPTDTGFLEDSQHLVFRDDLTSGIANADPQLVPNYPIDYASLLNGDNRDLWPTNPSVNHGVVTDYDGDFYIIPDANYNGPIELTYQVYDTTWGFISDVTRTFNITPVNDAPSAPPTLIDRSAIASELFEYTLPSGIFTDVDGDELTIIVDAPSWLTFNSETQTFSGTPTNEAVGEHIVRVAAIDPSNEAAITEFKINVAPNLSGISSAIENAAPSMGGGITGDGNGDGIPDSQQNNVVSLTTIDSNTWATFDTGTAENIVITNVQNEPAPPNIPSEMTAPYGVFSFNLENITTFGATVPMSIYLTETWVQNPDNLTQWINNDTGDVINGYWKQSSIDQQWINIATSISVVGGKLKIDFNLTDGDWTDDDGVVNGTIVDPGAPGNIVTNSAPTGNATGVLTNGTEDIVYSINTVILLEGFSDPDGDPLSVVGLTATNGALQDAGNGTWNFTPEANYSGPVVLNYQVSDGTTSSAAVNGFNIIPVADKPVLTLDNWRSFNFTGHITYIDDLGNALPGVNLGESFTGYFSFNTASIDSNSLASVGDYYQSKVGAGVSVSMQDYSFTTALTGSDSFLVEVVNNHSGRDNFLIREGVPNFV